MSVSAGNAVNLEIAGRLLNAVAWLVMLLSACACTRREEAAVPLSPRLQEVVKMPRQGRYYVECVILLRGSPLSPDEQKAAREYICQNPDASCIFLLLTLYSEWPKVYALIPNDTKAKVLCDMLGKAGVSSDWGLLSPDRTNDEIAGRALVGLGPMAIPFLTPLLDDNRECESVGSLRPDAGTKPRHADFAYRYIMLLLGRKPQYLADPTQRDELIVQLKVELKVPGAGAKVAPPKGLFGSRHRDSEVVRHVICLVDNSDTFPGVSAAMFRELRNSIGRLAPTQDFHVIFFAKDLVAEAPPRRLVTGNEANKREALAFLQEKPPAGRPSSPIAAMEAAFKAFKNRPNAKDQGNWMYILTTGDFDTGGIQYKGQSGNEAVIAWLRDNNSERLVHVCPILFGVEPDKETEEWMRHIAMENDGECVVVER